MWIVRGEIDTYVVKKLLTNIHSISKNIDLEKINLLH